MADYRPLVLSGTTAKSVITELPTSSILIADGVRLGASALSISGHLELTGGLSGTPSVSSTAINSPAFTGGTFTGTSVSSTTVSSTAYTGGSFTGASVSSTTVSSTEYTGGSFTGASVSATAVSGLTFNGMPYPAPFAYIQLTADDAASSDEKHIGYSNTPTSVVSDATDISWDDSAKNFVIHKAGTYEVIAIVIFEGGSTLVEMHVNKEGSPVNTANPRAHTTVDPVERTISAIFTAAATDVVDVTYEATSAQTTSAQIGTTVTIKRVK
tara:strand:+ start:11878 stop:12687 length:810 start_codon:yes stop_codon:yes gene_type:complete